MTPSRLVLDAVNRNPGSAPQHLVSIRDVRLSYGHIEVIRGVNLTVDMGETLVLCGPSGSGKSTLLRCVNGLETVSAGDVLVDGQSVVGCSRKQLRELRSQVGMVFQQFELYSNLTAAQNIALAPQRVLGLSKSEAMERAASLLRRVGLGDKNNSYPTQLSGGQQQRVAIARALAMKPKLLLIDEPTSALDPEMIREVLDVMRELANEGMTMIIVTHEMNFARDVADKVALLDSGEVVEYGSPQQIFLNPQSDRTKSFISAISQG